MRKGLTRFSFVEWLAKRVENQIGSGEIGRSSIFIRGCVDIGTEQGCWNEQVGDHIHLSLVITSKAFFGGKAQVQFHLSQVTLKTAMIVGGTFQADEFTLMPGLQPEGAVGDQVSRLGPEISIFLDHMPRDGEQYVVR